MQKAFQFLEEHGSSFPLGHIKIDQGGDFNGQADVGGEKKDRDAGFDLAHPEGDFAAVHAGHGIVQDDGFNRLALEEGQSGGAVESGQNAVACAFKEKLSDLKPDEFVIDTENKMGIPFHRPIRCE